MSQDKIQVCQKFAVKQIRGVRNLTNYSQCNGSCTVHTTQGQGTIVTARKRSLGQGNVFTPVCHSVHRGGHCPSMHHRSHGRGVSVQGGSLSRRVSVWGVWTEPPLPPTYGHERAFRILLQCILVLYCTCSGPVQCV